MQGERAKYKKAMQDLSEQQEGIRIKEIEFNHTLEVALQQKFKQERASLKVSMSEDIKASLMAENALQLKQLEDELQAKSKQVQELNASKATIAKLEREKEEIESRVQADAQIKMNQELSLIHI